MASFTDRRDDSPSLSTGEAFLAVTRGADQELGHAR